MKQGKRIYKSDLTVVIVNSNLNERILLQKMIRSIVGCSISIEEYSDLINALDNLRDTSLDLLFLEIHSSPFSGLDISKMFTKFDFTVIFTSVFHDAYFQKFNLFGIPYLELPIKKEELSQIITAFRSSEFLNPSIESYENVARELGIC